MSVGLENVVLAFVVVVVAVVAVAVVAVVVTFSRRGCSLLPGFCFVPVVPLRPKETKDRTVVQDGTGQAAW